MWNIFSDRIDGSRTYVSSVVKVFSTFVQTNCVYPYLNKCLSMTLYPCLGHDGAPDVRVRHRPMRYTCI